MGMGRSGGRRRCVASLDEGTMAADKWMVCAGVGNCGVSANRMGIEETRDPGFRMGAVWGGAFLFCCGADCPHCGDLSAGYFGFGAIGGAHDWGIRASIIRTAVSHSVPLLTKS
jgi:hypothetical protein